MREFHTKILIMIFVELYGSIQILADSPKPLNSRLGVLFISGVKKILLLLYTQHPPAEEKHYGKEEKIIRLEPSPKAYEKKRCEHRCTKRC